MSPPQQQLGGVRLAPGVTRPAMAAFYVAAIFSTGLMAFMNFVQPFVLTEVLKIPPERQGTVAGNLGFYSELVIIACIGFAGVWSDRIGRRPIYAAGFAILALAYVAYPRADSESELVAYRAIYAVGAAAVTAMLGAVISDYPSEPDRGKATGVMGVMNGLGILITLFLLAKLPQLLTRRGMDVRDAGLVTYGVASVLCLATAVLVARGLVKGRPADAGERPPFRVLVRRGLAAGRDPGVALAYGAAFVSRGDLVVVGTFLTLWVQRHGTTHGMDAAEALAKGGMIAGISQTAAFLWAPVIGYLSDRMHRVSVLALALALASAGYLSMGLVSDPTGGMMIAAVCLVGVGEISALITSQVLIAQQAPGPIRGSVLGVFGLCGAFGILVATKVGGHLFDAVAPSGPFVFMGALNLLLLLWALHVRRRGWVLAP